MNAAFYYSLHGSVAVKRVSFRVTFPEDLAHPFHRRITERSGVTRAELLTWGPKSTVSTLTWFDAERDVVAEVFDAVDSTTTTELVPGDGGTYAFVHQTEYEFPERLLELVARSRVVYLPPIRFFDDGDVQFEAAGRSRLLAAFYDDLDDLLDARIERVGDVQRWGSSTLTDRQSAALDAAVEVGYYEVPRSGSVGDVAERLDCSSSTAGELLRKAESRVIREFTDGR